eukprot:XP_001710254.1 Hypothetical protein GL50803_37131 [Giardia lamblia ATCC 50803]
MYPLPTLAPLGVLPILHAFPVLCTLARLTTQTNPVVLVSRAFLLLSLRRQHLPISMHCTRKCTVSMILLIIS